MADNPFGKLGAANINNALKSLTATAEWLKGLRDDLPKTSPAYDVLDAAAKQVEGTIRDMKDRIYFAAKEDKGEENA